LIFIEPTCKDDQHLTLNCSLIKRIVETLDLNYFEVHVHQSSLKYYKSFFENVLVFNSKEILKKKTIYLSTNLKTLRRGFFRSNSIFILHGVLEIFNEIKTVKRLVHVVLFGLALYFNRIRNNKLVLVGDHILENVKTNFWLKYLKFNLINLCFSKSLFEKIYNPEKSENHVIVLGNYHKGKWWTTKNKLKNVEYFGKIHSGKSDLSFINLNEGYLSLNKYYSLLSNCKAILILNKSYFFTSSYVLIEAIFLNKKIISYENDQSIFLKKSGLNIEIFKNEKELNKILFSNLDIKVNYNEFKADYNNQIFNGIKKVLC